ncbi:MAG: 4Fe-4S binding protein [Candidatus Spyradocola sp.]|jgi:ferredoxin
MKWVEVVFSPTGGTQKAADLLANGLGEETIQMDLTDSQANPSALSLQEGDVVLLAVPSYGGRVPGPAAQRIAALQGNGADAVLLCVYGNRAYEDTLVELRDLAVQTGFRVRAAVAAVAEHSIDRQFAAGRPDAQDAAQLAAFAKQIRQKLASGDEGEPSLPGNRPYKKSGGSGVVPKPTKDCVRCGLCARSCPVQAIAPNDPKEVDGKACISCMRCVAVCPHSARKVNPVLLAAVHAMLKKACSDRKACELFL